MNPVKKVYFAALILGIVTVAGGDVFAQSGARLSVPESAQEVRPLLIGARVPALALSTPEGKSFDLNEAIREKPAILIFYRGGWCPFCNAQLGRLAESQEALEAMGYQILAVSPDRPEKLRASATKHSLHYQLLSDSKVEAAMAFGVAFRVPDSLVSKYKTQYGIDLEADSGAKHHVLPVPSVFIIGKDGRIQFQYVNPDYKVRLDPETLEAAARAAIARNG